MRTIYKINKVVVIFNLVLVIISYFTMLFLPITGIIQLVMFGMYCIIWQSVAEPLKKHFAVYGFLVFISLRLLFFSGKLEYYRDFSLISSMVLGGLLSLYFLVICTSQWLYLKNLNNQPFQL